MLQILSLKSSFDFVGFQHVSKVEEFPVEKWDALIGVLLSAPFHLIRTLLPDMMERKWGRIINLASVHGVKASPFKAGYVSAKHGLVGLTKVVIISPVLLLRRFLSILLFIEQLLRAEIHLFTNNLCR